MNTQTMFSSKTDLWETPQDFFEKLNEEFHFTIDTAAIPINAKCERFYSPEDDGLSQPWAGRVWCNPPYGREIGKWVQKCAEEFAGGNCELAVMLLPARTDTRWFHGYILGKAEVRFLKGRLKFGGSQNSAPFPSMVVIWRKEPKP